MKNNDVIEAFFCGETAKTRHLKTANGILINYDTVIAVRADGKIILNAQKYSPTTSIIQNAIRRNSRLEVVEVEDEDTCYQMIMERVNI